MRIFNVSRQMAFDAAKAAMEKTGDQTAIWFMNRQDGWAWDFVSNQVPKKAIKLK